MRTYSLAIFALLLFIAQSFLYAQAPKNSPVEWGIVSDSERDMTTCEFEPDAGAVVLTDFGEWKLKSSGKNMGYKGILLRHTRIKILNEDGIEWAEGALSYVHAEKFEKVSGFKAQTINWDGEHYAYHPLEEENINKEKVDDYNTKISYAFPQVRVGSILELTYEFMTSDIIRLKPWYFQGNIPTLYSEMRKGENKGFDHVTILYNLEDEGHEENRWIIRNMPSLKEEPFVSNLQYYRARINFEIKDYQKSINTGYGRYIYKADLYKDWNDLNNNLLIRPVFIGPAKSYDKLKKITDSLISEVPDTLERLKVLYNFVRDSVEWNGRYAIEADNSAELTSLEEGKGNSAQINDLLRRMLEFGGITCASMVLGTVNHKPPVYDYPVLSQFNHRITIAQIGQKLYFLDAIDEKRPYYLLDEDDLVPAGWLIQPGGGAWVDIPNQYVSRQQTMANIEILNEEQLKVNVNSSLYGYYGLDMRRLLEELEADVFWKEFIRSGVEAAEITQQEIINQNDVDKPLSLKYSFNSSGFMQHAGERIYIDPMAIFMDKKNPFLAEERRYNIDMSYLHFNNLVVSILIPEGYEIESMPSAVRISLPEKSMTYLFSCERLGKQLQVSSRYETKKATFPPGAYPGLKELYDHMIAKLGEQIVLKRVSE